jgi:UDP-glucose 4-epimerase
MVRMKALVTGGAGFIGSNLVSALLERGDDVRVLDNFSTGNRANLDGIDVDIVEGELRSYERVHAAVRGVEVVYHLGALGSVPRSVQDPLTSSAVNVEGTLNVLLAARDEGVRRVIFASSTSVYGTSRELPTVESSPTDPISPYGVTKLAAERYCVSFSRVYHSFEAVVLRYFNVFGPRQSPHSQYAASPPSTPASRSRSTETGNSHVTSRTSGTSSTPRSSPRTPKVPAGVRTTSPPGRLRA